ncbi:hypothetical protein AN643_00060 [Candidatus Epulonipiscioides saccharophilum]|nr:hypothetical protein AN643_00060 [Epulopiscium sp. SCG-B10WGA-EpuloB]
MEVVLPLTFGRPILYATETGNAVIYPTPTDDFNNPVAVKRLISSILTDIKGEENKIILEYGESESNTHFVTPVEFLYDESFSATMRPLNNGEYQFIISKATPIETLTAIVRAYVDFRNLTAISTGGPSIEVKNNLSASEVLMECINSGLISLKYNDTPVESLENYTIFAITSTGSSNTVSGQAGHSQLVSFEIMNNISFAKIISPEVSISIAPVDRSNLTILISDALVQLNSILISIDGLEIDTNQMWVTLDEYNEFYNAIEVAQSATQNSQALLDEVLLQENMLSQAIDNFKLAKKSGNYLETIDTTELSAEIANALAVIENVTVSDLSTSDVSEGTIFVSSSQMQSLNESILHAQAVDRDPINETLVQEALESLQLELIDFIIGIKVGTQTISPDIYQTSNDHNNFDMLPTPISRSTADNHSINTEFSNNHYISDTLDSELNHMADNLLSSTDNDHLLAINLDSESSTNNQVTDTLHSGYFTF